MNDYGKDVKFIEEEKIHFFQKKMLSWYKKHGRRFPWRNKSATTFQKVIAEVLLQRTKAETVAKFYPKFIKQFPNWKSISQASLEELEEALQPIGLYKQRAKRLHALGVEMKKRGGRVPYDINELESIPMMGQYIANAAMNVVHDKPYPLLDVNMARVLERFFGPRDKADIRYDPYLQTLAYRVVNHRKSKEINWAVLDFGQKNCSKRSPKCTGCIIINKCSWGSVID